MSNALRRVDIDLWAIRDNLAYRARGYTVPRLTPIESAALESARRRPMGSCWFCDSYATITGYVTDDGRALFPVCRECHNSADCRECHNSAD